MNRVDYLKRLMSAYPSYKPADLQQAAALYLERLERYPVDAVAKAVDQLIDGSIWMPSVAEVVRAVEGHAKGRTGDAVVDAVGDRLHELMARRVRLEKGALYGEFDPGGWDALIRDYRKAGYGCGAAYCVDRKAVFAAMATCDHPGGQEEVGEGVRGLFVAEVMG